MGAELESAGASFISTSCVIVARFGGKVGDCLIQTRGELRVEMEKTSCEITK